MTQVTRKMKKTEIGAKDDRTKKDKREEEGDREHGKQGRVAS